MKIMDDIWQVGGAEYTTVEDAAVYLICFGPRAALIDAGCGSDHELLVANIAEAIPPAVEIDYLFLTHCHYDHSGGAAKVRNQYGCRIVAHELDAIYLEKGDNKVTAADWYGARMQPLKVDYEIKNKKETFQIGQGQLTAYHCPGHSPGSVVYVADMDSTRVLFGQDVHGPLDASFLSDRDDYIRSLNFMLDLNADILCEGHYGIYRGRDKINSFIRSFLDN